MTRNRCTTCPWHHTPGKVYSSRTARTRMSARDWAIAVAIAGPYVLLLLLTFVAVVFG